jgi:FAD/FMN-containing dehydrogenase
MSEPAEFTETKTLDDKMNNLQIASTNGGDAAIDASRLEQLAAAFRGRLLRPGDEGYDDSRTIWNAMIDRKPAFIAQCTGAADVKLAVEFAGEHKLLTAVRSVGHNIAGNAVCDNGLMIDLSQMRSVRIDPDARVAHIEPGVTLGDFDREAQAFGLVTPLGINSTTGVAGLTLGGGFGWLSRKYGMSIDSLSAADVITADGKFLRASEKENSDLFWAIRGGGGNFGVVTRFEFKLYPLEHDILSGLVVYPLKEAASALKKYREYAKKLGDDTSVWVVMRNAPPLPFLPEDVHGKGIIAFAICHAGDPEEGKKIIDPVRKFGTVLGEHIGVQPFAAWQAAFDPLLAPGARNYWKSHNFAELNDETIDIAIRYASNLPSSQSEIFFALLGGAVNRISTDTTAYPHRDVEFVLNVHGRWDDAGDDDKGIEWARGFFQDTAPHATGGVYTNFMTGDETDRVGLAYGPNYDRLRELKQLYDPENLFRLNQNVSPNGNGTG